MKQNMTSNEARSWAALSNKPVAFYSDTAGGAGIAWGNYCLGHKQAVLLLNERLFNLPVTPAMKYEAFEEFKQFHSFNGFGEKWDLARFNANSHYSWLKNKLRDQLATLKEENDLTVLTDLLE